MHPPGSGCRIFSVVSLKRAWTLCRRQNACASVDYGISLPSHSPVLGDNYHPERVKRTHPLRRLYET